jgi:hypothetical protein
MSFSKIFEKLIFTRLLRHLDANRILTKEQYGFRSNSSTENAAYDIFNEITKSMNEKRSLGGLFCDLKKPLIVSTIKFYWKNLNFMGLRETIRLNSTLPPRKIPKSTYKHKHSSCWCFFRVEDN